MWPESSSPFGTPASQMLERRSVGSAAGTPRREEWGTSTVEVTAHGPVTEPDPAPTVKESGGRLALGLCRSSITSDPPEPFSESATIGVRGLFGLAAPLSLRAGDAAGVEWDVQPAVYVE